MIAFGAVLVEPELSRTFSAKLKPISEKWVDQALAVSGHTRDDTLTFDDPETIMRSFANWVSAESKGRPFFISDNNGFDWGFVNWYFHRFLGSNPFGHSSTNLGSLYKGLVKDTYKSFKHLRETSHTHDPVDDAMGNAEALLKMKNDLGLGISLK